MMGWEEKRELTVNHEKHCCFDTRVSLVLMCGLCFNLALKKHKLTGDTSVMTYRGHGVLHTLIRCRFSPEFSTGQRFIYSGCSTGKIVSECLRAHLIRLLLPLSALTSVNGPPSYRHPS